MKKTQIDKAIESLDAEIAALQATRQRLMALKVKVAPRPRPRVAKTDAAERSA